MVPYPVPKGPGRRPGQLGTGPFTQTGPKQARKALPGFSRDQVTRVLDGPDDLVQLNSETGGKKQKASPIDPKIQNLLAKTN